MWNNFNNNQPWQPYPPTGFGPIPPFPTPYAGPPHAPPLNIHINLAPPRPGHGRGYEYPGPTGPSPMLDIRGLPPMRPFQNEWHGLEPQNWPQQDGQMPFQFSNCTGKRKALCIGINYVGQAGELKGCIRDVHNVKRFLREMFKYKEKDIVTLTDDVDNPQQIPTRENIIREMRSLVNRAQPHDSLFFHFSGHGGRTEDLDGNEADGFDEVIYPVDYEKTKLHIVDDEMNEIMVKHLPAGCRLTAIFDSCHSGSLLDLPFVYTAEGRITEPSMPVDIGSSSGFMNTTSSHVSRGMDDALRTEKKVARRREISNQKVVVDKWTKAKKYSPSDVIMFSGCEDSQTSADTIEDGKNTGAMSYAFSKALYANPEQTYQQLLVEIRRILKSLGYDQEPQLSSSHPIDTNNTMFFC